MGLEKRMLILNLVIYAMMCIIGGSFNPSEWNMISKAIACVWTIILISAGVEDMILDMKYKKKK